MAEQRPAPENPQNVPEMVVYALMAAEELNEEQARREVDRRSTRLLLNSKQGCILCEKDTAAMIVYDLDEERPHHERHSRLLIYGLCEQHIHTLENGRIDPEEFSIFLEQFRSYLPENTPN